MKNLSIFQLVFLGIFFLFALVGFIIVAIYSRDSGNRATQPISVKIWGTLDASVIQPVVAKATQSERGIQVTYEQKSAGTFESDVVSAVAKGTGPDIILLRDDTLVSSIAILSPILYKDYPARSFKDAFIQEGETFLLPAGITAIPFAVDPLVMYWNRDLFSRQGLANPPQYWDEVFAVAQQLTRQDGSGGITQSAVALGGYDNVVHAKEILLAMLLQSGNPMAVWNNNFTSVDVRLSSSASTPATSILSFYTQFSDPRKSVFSWSQALADSKSLFLSNRLAVYFGFASELSDIKAKSPNLNFDVTYFPQSRTGPVTGTFAHLYGLAILHSSPDVAGSLKAIQLLTSKDSISQFVSLSHLPPVRKDIAVPASDPYQTVFQQSAFISRTWLDPNRTASDGIFRDMVGTVVSGFTSPADAVSKAEQALQYAAPR